MPVGEGYCIPKLYCIWRLCLRVPASWLSKVACLRGLVYVSGGNRVVTLYTEHRECVSVESFVRCTSVS